MTTEENLLTPEQHMRLLRDQALFSDSTSARCKAVDELVEKYGIQAMPTVMELIESCSGPYDSFRYHCVKAGEKIFKSTKENIESQNR
jgi:hypothetical protein